MTLWTVLACAPGDGEVRDAHNAATTVELEVGSLAAAEASDAWLDWGGLDEDLAGLDLEPSSVHRAELLVFHLLDADEVVEGLASETLRQGDLFAYRECASQSVGCSLSDFTLHGADDSVAPYFLPDQLTWLLSLRDDLGRVRSLAFLEPSPEGPGQVVVQPDTSSLSVVSDLASRPVVLVEDRLDWSGLVHDTQGRELDPRRVDGLRLGRFDLAVEELEGRLPQLEELAEELWVAEIDGVSIALEDLDGPRTLEQLDRDWTWILALDCSSCLVPLPRALVVLEGR